MTIKAQECREKHSIIIRIIKGLPACVMPGGEVVHNDIGCCRCRYEDDDKDFKKAMPELYREMRFGN